MLELSDMLCESIAVALIFAPICYLVEYGLTTIFLYCKYGQYCKYFMKAYHWRFKLLVGTFIRGMKVKIKTFDSSLKYIEAGL